MKVLVYHPTGNQNVRALIRGLARHDMLQSFHTTVAVFEASWYYPLLKGKLSKLKRRTYDDMIRPFTHTYPLEELLMFAGRKKIHGKELNPHAIDEIVTFKVIRYIKKHHNKIDAIYCYPGNASLIMQAAHNYGIPCFFEITTAYYKEIKNITDIEKKHNPLWANTISLYTNINKCKELDRELELSSFILCASNYIEQTLIRGGYLQNKIKVIPYGFPSTKQKKYTIHKKIKLLYVGSITQAKGLSYMFEAVNKMKEFVELTIIGSNDNPFISKILEDYNYLGSIPHNEVIAEMSKADILLFPTLTDGFGMVVTEAMSVGTPVIATINSCATDIIKKNHNGWIIPIQDSDAIVTILNQVIINPELISLYGIQALKTASEHPWIEYENQIVDFINNKLRDYAR